MCAVLPLRCVCLWASVGADRGRVKPDVRRSARSRSQSSFRRVVRSRYQSKWTDCDTANPFPKMNGLALQIIQYRETEDVLCLTLPARGTTEYAAPGTRRRRSLGHCTPAVRARLIPILSRPSRVTVQTRYGALGLSLTLLVFSSMFSAVWHWLRSRR